MVDLNACVNGGNDRDVLLVEFGERVGTGEGTRVTGNKLYEEYLGRVAGQAREAEVNRVGKAARCYTVSSNEHTVVHKVKHPLVAGVEPMTRVYE